jgi:DNA-binding beta-propeller fold protein YncE
MAANLVIGQSDFVQNHYNRGLGAPAANTLAGPTGVALAATGALMVADRNNNRVTVYDGPLTSGAAATAILGGPGPVSSTTLNTPTNVAVDSVGNLFVADHFNHRVLRFTLPFTTGMPADLVIGQSSLTESSFGTTATTLYYPYGLAIDHAGGLLLVADGLNNRVLRYDPPLTSGMAATGVFGQLGSFTNRLENLGGPPSADSMKSPMRLAMDQARNLYVADSGNYRVLIFDLPLPFREYLPLILR